MSISNKKLKPNKPLKILPSNLIDRGYSPYMFEEMKSSKFYKSKSMFLKLTYKCDISLSHSAIFRVFSQYWVDSLAG